MQRESTGDPRALSKTDHLRRQVGEAPDDTRRLAALIALARHYADASDGVNGLVTSREARTLALRLKNYAAAAAALSSASISHYHRSDYVSAVATAMDAWDSAVRADSPIEIAESYFAMGLSMMALGKPVERATRGVAADVLPAAQLLLADALALRGRTSDVDEAAQLRTSSERLRTDNAVSRGLAAEDVQRLAARILG